MSQAAPRIWGVSLRLFAVGVLLAAVSGCATSTRGNNDAAAPASPADPWERWNRKVYAFNEKVDEAVLKPVATAYVEHVPQAIRTGVSNFYGNFSDAWSAVNNLLQGKFISGLQDLMRVGTNTLFGVAGIFDVASDIGLERHDEDFGQTLGRWGVGAGPYVVWPILGPSTVRDSVALVPDLYGGSPAWAVNDDSAQYFITGIGIVNTRANLLPTTRMLDDMALDKYSFVRDGFLQRRRSLIYDGNEPEEDDGGQVDLPQDGAAAEQAAAPEAAASTPGAAKR